MGIKDRIRSAAGERVVALKGKSVLAGAPAFYVREIEDNLIPGVVRADFYKDLMHGDGSEISRDGIGPHKFCAAYSSSALVVNTFGPFRSAPENLLLPGQTGFPAAWFEHKCSVGLVGKSPNLDFFASSDTLIVGVESKFTEFLSPKAARFSPGFERLFAQQIPAGWHAMYLSLQENPGRFRYLDAAQLVKHYLGLRHHFRLDKIQKKLLYLFWEPSDGSAVSQFQEHRKELETFKEQVDGGDIEFDYMSYPELWAEWLENSQWPDMGTHVAHLQDRYAFAVESGAEVSEAVHR